MNAWDLLKNIGVFTAGSTILLTALAFIARNVFVHFLSHDLESHKAKLAAGNALALEQFKAQLQTAAFEHQTRFSHLHEERGKVIAELYKNLAAVATAVKSLSAAITLHQKVEQGQVTEASRLMGKFRDHFDVNRFYFDPALCDLIDRLLPHFLGAWITSFGLQITEYTEETGKKLFETVREILTIRNEIETRLRDMLGVAAPNGMPNHAIR